MQPTASVNVASRIDAVRRLVEDGFNAGDRSVGALCAPDFVNYVCAYGVPAGPAGLTEHIELIRAAYPDLTMAVTDVVAGDDEVSVRWISGGTAHGEYMGNTAGDYQFRTTQIAFYTFRDALLVDWHGNYDPMAMGRPAGPGAAPSPDPQVWAEAVERPSAGPVSVDTEQLEALLNGPGTEPASGLALSTSLELTVNGQPVPEGRTEFSRRYDGLRRTFDAPGITVDRLVVQGDRIALRWSLVGRHVQPFLGIRPTGRRVRLTSSAILHVDGDQIVTWHEVFDDVGFLDQTKTAYVLSGS